MATTVDKAKVNQSGIDLLDNVNKMYTTLNEIKDCIDGSKSYFDSNAGNTLRNKFNESAEKFTEFRKFLDSYGEFLKNFSGNVTSYEDSMQQAVNSIEKL